GRVLLRRTADHGEGPDRIPPMVDAMHAQHGEVVAQAVVAEVVAEGTLGLFLVGVHRAGDDEVRIGGDAETLVVVEVAEAPPAERAGEGERGEPPGPGHHRGEGMRRRPADEDARLERLALLRRLPLVHADAAADLVAQTALAIRLV